MKKLVILAIILSVSGCEITDYDFLGLHNHAPEVIVYNYLEDGFLTFKGYCQTWDTAGILIEVEKFTIFNWDLLYGRHRKFCIEPEKSKHSYCGRFWLYMSKDSILTSSDTIRILMSDTVRLHIETGQCNKHTTIIFEP